MADFDTATKRFSGLGWRGRKKIPQPNGALDGGDRQTLTKRYSGISWSPATAVLSPLKAWYYVPGPVPMDAPAWMRREIQSISQATYGSAPVLQMQVRGSPPQKPREGMVAYADGSGWDPGDGVGLYVRVANAWIKLG